MQGEGRGENMGRGTLLSSLGMNLLLRTSGYTNSTPMSINMYEMHEIWWAGYGKYMQIEERV